MTCTKCGLPVIPKEEKFHRTKKGTHHAICPHRDPINFDAYYFSFHSTGVELIDRILGAIVDAGNIYHHTQDWTERRGAEMSCADAIQKAADRAAQESCKRMLRELAAEERIRAASPGQGGRPPGAAGNEKF